jgi:hypothetical protein
VSPFRPSFLSPPRVCFRNQQLLPSYAPRNVNISPILSTLRILPVDTGVSLLEHSPSMPLPSLCSLCLCGKCLLFSSLPPLETSLRSFCNSRPLFSIDCRLFCENTGGGGGRLLPTSNVETFRRGGYPGWGGFRLCSPLVTRHSPPSYLPKEVAYACSLASRASPAASVDSFLQKVKRTWFAPSRASL